MTTPLMFRTDGTGEALKVGGAEGPDAAGAAGLQFGPRQG